MHFFCFALFICLHAIHSVLTLHTVNLHHRLLQLIKSVPLSLLQFNVFLCICLPSPLAAKDETSAESKKLTTLTTQFLYSNVSIFILFGTQKFLSNVLYDSLIFWRQIKKPGGMVAQ